MLLFRKNWPMEGLPVSGSHMRLGIFVLPGNTREKAELFGGGNQMPPDVIVSNN